MNAIDIDTTERKRFVRGPARAVFPAISLSIGPEIITAPGDISLIGETIDSRVISAPNVVSRNSAHRP